MFHGRHEEAEHVSNLIATILGAVIAIIGGFLGGMSVERMSQRFNRKERRRKILEETYEAALNVQAHTGSMMLGALGPSSGTLDKWPVNPITSLRMKIELYTPELLPAYEELWAKLQEFYRTYAGYMKKTLVDKASPEDYSLLVNQPAEEVMSLCEKIMSSVRDLVSDIG